jgi:O-antigen polymerase
MTGFYKYLSRAQIAILSGLLITPLVYFNIAYGVVYAKAFWVYFISLLLALITLITFRKKLPNLSFTDIIVILFLVYLSLQSIVLNCADGNAKLLFFLSGGVCYFSCRWFISSFSELNYSKVYFWSFSTIFVVCLITCAIALLQKAGVLKSFNPAIEVTGVFFHSAPLGIFLGIVLPIAFSCWLQSFSPNEISINSFLKYLSFATVCAIILVLPATHSRAAMLGTFFSIIFVVSKAIVNAWQRLRTILKIGAGILAIILTTAVLIKAYDVRPESIRGRLLVWKVSIEMIKAKPLTGWGLDQFKTNYPEYQEQYFKNKKAALSEIVFADEVSSPFNEILQFFIETGFVGFLLFITLVYSVFRRAKGSIYSKAAKAALVCFLISSIFSYPFSLAELTIYFFILLALAHSSSDNNQFLFLRSKGRWIYTSVIIFFGGILLLQFSTNIKQLYGRRYWRNALTANSKFVAESYFEKAYPVFSANDRFLSDFGIWLSEKGDIIRSNNLLSKIKGKTYRDLLTLGMNYQREGREKTAISYYYQAHYLLPNQLLPLYFLMIIYKNEEPALADKVAEDILRVPVRMMTVESNIIILKAKDQLQH